MTHGAFHTPDPVNEPVRPYAPGSPEVQSIRTELDRQQAEQVDIPIIIDGEEIRTGDTEAVRAPHNHSLELGVFHKAGPAEIQKAIDASQRAKAEWAAMPWEQRAAIFLRVGELLAGPWRDRLNASTMIGQSKTVHQAEIDAACELIDFMRFNVRFAEELYGNQPNSSAFTWNRLEHRPLDGFVFAVSPFNFTSIAGNLPTAPALMGNTCVWKPASTTVLSNYYLMRLFEEAGLPKGVINFVPGSGAQVGDHVVDDPNLAGIHFTGSTATFQHIWKRVGNNIAKYGCYPRLVGETGGKDFIFAHPSADLDSLVPNTVRGAFEYQGQKCSAASRAYIPKSLWNEYRDRLGAELAQVKMGDINDFSNFMGAVIDGRSYGKLKEAIDAAKSSTDTEVLFGGGCDDSKGWFIEPTVIQATQPKYDTMCRELFGPVLSLYVYDDDKFEETLELCDQSSPYALTGAIFANDRAAVTKATDRLRFSAGNFYINDKPTGAVVGQQPFGGSRASGTNDKAGSILNLFRWVSPRTIKENLQPATDWRYPFLG